jgi:hypothetical protein
MNNKAIAMISAMISILAAQACSSDDPSGAGGSSSATSSSATSSSDTSSASASTGGATGCMSTMPIPSPGCPDTPTAEGAYAKMRDACGVVKEDFDITDPNSPTLTPAGKGKLCATCACQQEVINYYAVYANCTSEDQGNAVLAKNIHDVVVACP